MIMLDDGVRAKKLRVFRPGDDAARVWYHRVSDKTASRAGDEKRVVAWLKELRMEKYAKAFVRDGYDELQTIATMSMDEVRLPCVELS